MRSGLSRSACWSKTTTSGSGRAWLRTLPLVDGGWWYLRQLPLAVPPRLILVDDMEAWPGRRPGPNGFRAFLTTPHPERFVPCDCAWASDSLGPHFRTKRP